MRRLPYVLGMLAIPVCFAVTQKVMPVLIGGQPLDSKNFPEIVYIKTESGRCSATVIGPQALLTAAHCMDSVGQMHEVSFEILEQKYIATCEQSSLYRDDKEIHDIALCKIDKTVKVVPATIAKRGPKINEEVFLIGYGCTEAQDGVTRGGNDGIMRGGLSKVFRLPKGANHWFYTRGSAALCFGDSGGPALLNHHDKHALIGINSRGDIRTLSLLTALYTETSQSFFKEFSIRHSIEICGINIDC